MFPGEYSEYRAHPRVCGENPHFLSHDSCHGGSSPRVRGKVRGTTQQVVLPGLIPACAGKTDLAYRKCCALGAHPRVCGENTRSQHSTLPLRGSSPRVRGKRYLPDGGLANRRLIPACAGKTVFGCGIHARARAHPRVCGENTSIDKFIPQRLGSSPRVRGKLNMSIFVSLAKGLIPACAGKTRVPVHAAQWSAAHPRVCGENVGGANGADAPEGSSPRVRGKLQEFREASERSGAHPRVCGENRRHLLMGQAGRGSSPRVRGKRAGAGACAGWVGLIPACAGKTIADGDRP